MSHQSIIESIKRLDSAIARDREAEKNARTAAERQERERKALFDSLTPEEKKLLAPPPSAPAPAPAKPESPKSKNQP